MSENVSELSTKQHLALRALLANHNVPGAAKQAGVHERTLYRWLGEPAFRQALTEAEGQALDAATRRLVGLAEAAVTVIATVLADRNQLSSARLRAAELVLSNLLKLLEVRSLAQRVADLEERQYE